MYKLKPISPAPKQRFMSPNCTTVPYNMGGTEEPWGCSPIAGEVEGDMVIMKSDKGFD